MTRIQIARDRAMAQAVVKARVPGKTVLLVSGAGHSAEARWACRSTCRATSQVKAVRLLAGDADRREPGAFDAVWRRRRCLSRTTASPPRTGRRRH